MCTQAPAPGYTLCMQAPAANFKTPDWLRTGPNQSGAGAWVHIVYAGAGAWVHIMYAGAGAWVHILAPFAPSVTRLVSFEKQIKILSTSCFKYYIV